MLLFKATKSVASLIPFAAEEALLLCRLFSLALGGVPSLLMNISF
jgi:hypothetical protein